MTKLRLGSRGSALARWQAEHVRDRLAAARADAEVEIHWLRTTGDRVRDVPLARIGDKGLFTKEIDRAVLEGEVDAAVHSLKDMPTRLVDGLVVGAIFGREDARDAFLPAPGQPARLADLPADATVGTSSLRRRAQLLHRRSDLRVADLRGNLDTRLERLHAGDFDAALLAVAGLLRLGRADAIGETLARDGWLPAAGQGALAVAARADDDMTLELLASLDDPDTRATTTAERAFLRELEGGCQIPIGALATIEVEPAGNTSGEGDGGTRRDADDADVEGPDGFRLHLDGFVSSLDGRDFLRDAIEGEVDEAASLGRRLAARLRERGAVSILERARRDAEEHLPRASAP